MVLVDAVSKLETFVWILNHISMSITWSLFTLKASYSVKGPISTWSFMWWCQSIDWLKFETPPISLLNFGTTYRHASFSFPKIHFHSSTLSLIASVQSSFAEGVLLIIEKIEQFLLESYGLNVFKDVRAFSTPELFSFAHDRRREELWATSSPGPSPRRFSKWRIVGRRPWPMLN